MNRNKTKGYSFMESSTKEQKSTVIIRGIEIVVDIAETNEEIIQGLSGRKSLGVNEGMLFLFESNSMLSFWMKDMLIPIDIIWIADNSIVDIHKNIPAPDAETPYANLPLYTPEKPINYVLEVNAGFAEQNNFNVGDTVIIRF
jgi:uncharacterized membrane protein (UPF0127 family)